MKIKMGRPNKERRVQDDRQTEKKIKLQIKRNMGQERTKSTRNERVG